MCDCFGLPENSYGRILTVKLGGLKFKVKLKNLFVVSTRTLMGLASSSSSERLTFGTVVVFLLSLTIEFLEDFLSVKLTLYFCSSFTRFESRVVGSLSNSALSLADFLQ